MYPNHRAFLTGSMLELEADGTGAITGNYTILPGGSMQLVREDRKEGWEQRNGLTLLGGEDCIHRFDGTVEIDGHNFINEGEKWNRLTFVLMGNIGYVYFRGKGKVSMKDGSEVKLGY